MITRVPSGFSGYIWLDTKNCVEKKNLFIFCVPTSLNTPRFMWNIKSIVSRKSLLFSHSRSRTYQVASLRAGHVTCDLINEYTCLSHTRNNNSSFLGIWLKIHVCWQFEVSPLELAIETIDETNQKLSSLVDQSYTDPSLRIDTLGMVLHGVVDAAVNGGIANYKVLLSTLSDKSMNKL